jgi:AraC family transcriptional regulator of arabinose operon
MQASCSALTYAPSMLSAQDSALLSNASAALGGLNNEMPDYLYALSRGRRIYTTPWLRENPLRRCDAAIILSTSHTPFSLLQATRNDSYAACALKPMVWRALRAENVGVVAFQFDPSHACYPRFRRIAAPGVLPLARGQFDRFNDLLMAAYRGELNAEQAGNLFEEVVAIATSCLPRAKPIDQRVAQIVELLWRRCDYPLTELAAVVGLSASRLSHLFADNMGMTLRSYQQWRKIRKAISLSKHGYTMAQLAAASGFADAAHFSRAFVQLHAAPPSYFLKSGNVKIIATQSGLNPSAAESRAS